jgi:WD40 repeat protein
MPRRFHRLSLAIGLAVGLCQLGHSQDPGLGGNTKSDAGSRQRVDINGDPLPDGAIARLGLGRLKHAGKALAVAFSPDGRILASGGEDRLIRLWDTTTGKELGQFTGHESTVATVTFSPNGKILASGSWDKTIRFWDVSTRKGLPLIINHPGEVSSIAYSPDGKTLASGGTSEGGSVYLWETGTTKEVRRWKAHQGGVWSLAFSPDGKTLATGGDPRDSNRQATPEDNYAVALWDPATGKRRTVCRGHTEFVGRVAFSSDGKLLASTGFDKRHGRSINLWETTTGKEVRFLPVSGARNYPTFAFAPDGKTIAAGDFYSIIFWDVVDGKQLRSLKILHRDQLLAITFSPDGKTLASAGEEGDIRLWDVARRKERFDDLPGHRERITSIAASPDGRTVVTGSFDGTARVWEWATGKPGRQFRDEGGPWGGILVWCVALSPDGKTLALSHRGDAGITLWSVAGGTWLRRLTGHKDRITSIAFSPDGKTLVSEGIDDVNLHLWDVATGIEKRKLKKNQERGIQAAFSPDGRIIASVATDGVYLWEAATGKQLHFLKDRWGALAFSPDGFLLALVDEKLCLLDPVTTKEIGQHDGGRQAWGHSAAISPEGRLLALASGEGVRLMEVVTGLTVRTFRGHLRPVTCLAFSPDGKALITGSEDCTALVWDLRELVKEKGKPALKPEKLQAAWEDLKGDDRLKAYEAACRLRGAPEQTLALLQKQLRPAVATDPKRIARFIADLNRPRFQTRERAARQLTELGDVSENALRRVLKDRPPLEVRKRVERLLETLEESLETRRRQWAVTLLERAGTAEARRVLEALAKGDSESRQTREARASLERLDQKRPLAP